VSEAGYIVEWHRVAGAKAILRPLLYGAGALMLGPAIAVTGILLGRHTPALVAPAIAIGGTLALLGPVITLIGMRGAFKEDAILAARSTGVTFERDGQCVTLPWDDLEAIAFEAPDAIVFKKREGEPYVLRERFDVPGDELAKRFETLRRKASMNLLPKG